MNTFLSELGAKLAERWVTLLALPGLLFLATMATAGVLGQRHALDWDKLINATGTLAKSYDRRPVPAVVAAVAVLLAASAVGLVARGLAAGVERLWLAAGPRWLVKPLVERRHSRWKTASQAYANARDARKEDSAAHDARRAALADARNRIALCEPARPTWIGDRLRCAGVRIHNQYGFDLQFAWTRLWLLLPDTARHELRAARDALTAATIQTAWGLLYLGVGVRWWPAAIAGLTTAVVAWRRGRTAAATFADLVEAVADLYNADLAKSLGIKLTTDHVTPNDGRMISERLRKGT
jgi:hypothetical protein